MDLLATTDGVNPTTVIGLLSVVITAILAGVGWAGRRWLGADGLQEKQTEATMAMAVATAGTNKALESTAAAVQAVAECVRQHDERAAASIDGHANICRESQVTLNSMHAAALQTCDELIKLHQYNPDHLRMIDRIRQELIRQELKSN